MSVVVVEKRDTVVIEAAGQPTVEVHPIIYELEIVSAGAMGPPGAQGPQGTQGVPGAGFNYTHDQAIPAAQWDITHNLNGRPNVTTVDSAGSVVEGDVQYLSANAVRVIFASAFSGQAYLS